MVFSKKILTNFSIRALIFFGSCLTVFAAEIIDIDKFSFHSTQLKGIRIVSFNTDAQCFSEVHYFVQKTATPFNLKLWGIEFDSNCNVNLSSKFKLKDHIFTTKGTLKINGKDLAEKVTEEEDADDSNRWIIKEIDDFQDCGEKVTRLILSYKKMEIKSAEYISRTINDCSSKTKSQGAFKAIFHKGEDEKEKIFSNLSSEVADNNRERGILGELATSLTMISFGYKCHFSKYGTDNGFDGVFTDDSKKPEMFITESKCRERADGVNTIMKDCLAEGIISNKLERIFAHDHPTLSANAKENLLETGKLIRKFISKNPGKIFKFAHRIKPDGRCQCLIEKFDSGKHQMRVLQTLSPQSPTKDKLLVLNGIANQLCLTEDKKAELFMKSLEGAPEDKLKLVFDALKIDEDKQADILAIITKKKKVKKVLKYDSSEEG